MVHLVWSASPETLERWSCPNIDSFGLMIFTLLWRLIHVKVLIWPYQLYRVNARIEHCVAFVVILERKEIALQTKGARNGTEKWLWQLKNKLKKLSAQFKEEFYWWSLWSSTYTGGVPEREVVVCTATNWRSVKLRTWEELTSGYSCFRSSLRDLRDSSRALPLCATNTSVKVSLFLKASMASILVRSISATFFEASRDNACWVS